MKVSLQTCPDCQNNSSFFRMKIYFHSPRTSWRIGQRGVKIKGEICGRGWMPGWRHWCWMSTLGYRVSIETKSCTTPYRPPALLFFFYFLMILRPGWAPLVLKEEEENHRRRGHPDLVTTYDCGFFFSFPPAGFLLLRSKGRLVGLSSTVVRQQSPSLNYTVSDFILFFCFIIRVAIRWGVHCTWAVQRGGVSFLLRWRTPPGGGAIGAGCQLMSITRE